jgi:hypothetical protein
MLQEFAISRSSLKSMKPHFALFAALSVAAAFLSAPAFAAPIERAFGNTIQSTYPDGRQAELWLQRGGVYHAKGRRGQDTSGRWRMSGNRLCLNQQRPFPAPIHYCTPIPDRFEGAWQARAPTGERISVTLINGHVVGRKGQPRR